MSDSTVFNAGQSLRRREMMKAAAAGTVGFGMAAASSGTVAADDDDYDYMPDPSIRHAFINPGIETLYNYVTAYGDGGYPEESVEEMSADNTLTRIWQGTDSVMRALEGAAADLENYMDAGDPVASPLAEMVYSVLRSTALQAVQDGSDVTEARIEAEDAALDELSTPATNVVRQWNEHVFNILNYLLTFADGEPEFEDVDHSDGETIQEMDPVQLQSGGSDGLPHIDDTININYQASTIQEVGIRVEDYSLPNGDTESFYIIDLYGDDTDYSPFALGIDWVDHSSTNNPDVRVWAPDKEDVNSEHWKVLKHSDLPFADLLEAIDTIRSDIQSEAGDWVEDVMNAYNADDLGEMDILSSYDLVREYGDSGGMTRYTAEMMAVGMDPQDDLTNVVTIDHPDTGEQSGRLFLSWDWSELRDWEYSYDAETLTLEIAEESIDEEPELVAVFDDDGTEVTETITTDDLDNGTHEFDADNGTLEAIERLSEGNLNSHIPVGETTGHWNSAIFLHEGEESTNFTQLDTADPFELVSVTDEDGNDLDKLELSGWENQTRDPARSLEEAQHLNEQYVTVDELEETAHGGGGGGGGTDTNALLIGGGLIALVGMVIAALSSGDS